MDYEKLEDENDEVKMKVAYAEMITSLLMTAMLCTTLVLMTTLLVEERESEMSFFREYANKTLNF